MVLRWLIGKSRLEEHLKSRNGKESVIIITGGNNKEGFRLCSKGLKFGGGLKIVEK